MLFVEGLVSVWVSVTLSEVVVLEDVEVSVDGASVFVEVDDWSVEGLSGVLVSVDGVVTEEA